MAQPQIGAALPEKIFEPIVGLPYLVSIKQPGRTTNKMAFATQTLEINGCKLSFARGGKGEPLIY